MTGNILELDVNMAKLTDSLGHNLYTYNRNNGIFSLANNTIGGRSDLRSEISLLTMLIVSKSGTEPLTLTQRQT